ncbi:PAS domain-containing protein [Polyangium aurulentum]|uniref:PAS domain-containing protein n=1 Tax=Polyangium aurulentum TaxID=2567896 RepID=UPI0010AE1161|nr:PAS domain-containing protein [Polyangium aurulentum]UQA58969.1 PAS domain-containing protein [Polyangium aurulentum]
MAKDREEIAGEIERLRRQVSELEAAAAERDELAEKLAQTEQHARMFVKHSPLGIALLDRDLRYILASDSWLKILHLENQDVIGRSHLEVFPDMPQSWNEALRRCLAGETVGSEEDSQEREDGSVDWFRWKILPWRTREGEIGGVLIFSEDLTERKRLQDEVAAQAATLRELGTPIVPMSDEVLVMPLVGTLSPERSQQIIEQLLGRIVEAQARTAIIDVTGVPLVDSFAASSLIQIAQAVRLLGAEVVLTGIRPEVAQALVTQDVDISTIVTRRDLQSGVAWAMRARR